MKSATRHNKDKIINYLMYWVNAKTPMKYDKTYDYDVDEWILWILWWSCNFY